MAGYKTNHKIIRKIKVTQGEVYKIKHLAKISQTPKNFN